MKEESKEKSKQEESHRTGIKFDPFYIEGSIHGLKKSGKEKDKTKKEPL